MGMGTWTWLLGHLFMLLVRRTVEGSLSFLLAFRDPGQRMSVYDENLFLILLVVPEMIIARPTLRCGKSE